MLAQIAGARASSVMVTLLVRGVPAAGRAGFEAAITISVTVPAAGPVAAFSRV